MGTRLIRQFFTNPSRAPDEPCGCRPDPMIPELRGVEFAKPMRDYGADVGIPPIDRITNALLQAIF
ncbi:hypothetical protein [Skermanella stibiiresistens]|nr:hypothetical protein [Skermanella stibiiresistens]